jgi:hypothetical protein
MASSSSHIESSRLATSSRNSCSCSSFSISQLPSSHSPPYSEHIDYAYSSTFSIAAYADGTEIIAAEKNNTIIKMVNSV